MSQTGAYLRKIRAENKRSRQVLGSGCKYVVALAPSAVTAVRCVVRKENVQSCKEWTWRLYGVLLQRLL